MTRLLEFNRQPSDRQLRQFGAICLFALPLIAWIWSSNATVVFGFGFAGLVVAIAGMLYPPAIKPLFLGLSLIAKPIGLVIGELAMLLIYIGLFTPFALAFRLMRRDALRLRLDRDGASYWTPKQPPKSVSSYYRQS